MLQIFITVANVDNFGIQFVRPFFKYSNILFEGEKRSHELDNKKLDE